MLSNPHASYGDTHVNVILCGVSYHVADWKQDMIFMDTSTQCTNKLLHVWI